MKGDYLIGDDLPHRVKAPRPLRLICRTPPVPSATFLGARMYPPGPTLHSPIILFLSSFSYLLSSTSSILPRIFLSAELLAKSPTSPLKAAADTTSVPIFPTSTWLTTHIRLPLRLCPPATILTTRSGIVSTADADAPLRPHSSSAPVPILPTKTWRDTSQHLPFLPCQRADGLPFLFERNTEGLPTTIESDSHAESEYDDDRSGRDAVAESFRIPPSAVERVRQRDDLSIASTTAHVHTAVILRPAVWSTDRC